MSPLPKKKKTPEELAALRESLGISSEGPPQGAPGVMGEGPVAAPEAPPEDPPRKSKAPVVEKRTLPAKEPKEAEKVEPEESEEPAGKEKAVVLKSEEAPVVKSKPAKTFRKSASLPVDKPKKVTSKNSGKLPTRRRSDAERIPLEKPAKSVSGGGAKLPTRKHTDQELARIRHTPLPGGEVAAAQIPNQAAGIFMLIAVYGVGGLLMILAALGALAARTSPFDLPFDWLRNAVDWPNFTMIVYGIMTAGVAVMLLGGGWIFFKKPISQHHAAILTIIAVLVLVFGTLYFFPELHGA
ncbi:hypothetical protein [Haloferula sp.]|uniref:hypothetical protein n=1 Tax=Haloferula sp. TaxID=2497595 RepID=UPI00329FDE47